MIILLWRFIHPSCKDNNKEVLKKTFGATQGEAHPRISPRSPNNLNIAVGVNKITDASVINLCRRKVFFENDTLIPT